MPDVFGFIGFGLVVLAGLAVALGVYGSLRLWWERFLTRPLDLAPLTDDEEES